VNKYYFTFDIKGLKRTLNNAENYLIEDPNNYYANYYNGIIRYCLGRVLYNTDSDVSYDYFDTALDMFEKSYSIEKNPVSLAMISAAYGKLSALSPLRAIFWGQKAKNRIYDAFNLDSNNSKILLVAATHLMHVPGIYGGDKKKARRMLEKCIEINKSNVNQNEYELNWANNAEITAYIAQLDILEEKPDSARQNMKKALQLQPRYGFVIIDLENQISQLSK
jgi:tetratricopeptide (TPR) repeat protein